MTAGPSSSGFGERPPPSTSFHAITTRSAQLIAARQRGSRPSGVGIKVAMACGWEVTRWVCPSKIWRLSCSFSGGPPGARTRHLGIKSAGQDLAKCYRAVRNVAISQVGVAIQPERRDSSRLTATGCDGLVGTVQLDVICGRPVSGARSTVEGRWALQPAGSHR